MQRGGFYGILPHLDPLPGRGEKSCFTSGMSAAVVANFPDLMRSYSSLTQPMWSLLRSSHKGIGVRRFCLSISANSTTTSSRIARQIVQLAHVDAVGRARLGAKVQNRHVAVVDGEVEEFSAGGFAGGFVDLVAGRFYRCRCNRRGRPWRIGRRRCSGRPRTRGFRGIAGRAEARLG